MVKNKYKIIPQNHEDSKELLKSWVNFYVIASFYALIFDYLNTISYLCPTMFKEYRLTIFAIVVFGIIITLGIQGAAKQQVSESRIEIPLPLQNASEQILYRKGYTVSYNKENKIPNWVAWHLTAEHATGPYRRPGNAWHEDLQVPAPRATLADYKDCGWTRGHMCPAGDNKWDDVAMYDTFLFTNCCPQNGNLNSGDWNQIEMSCRRWAQKHGDIYIVCGPILFRQKHETIGPNKIVVPEAFFKVVLCLNGKPKGIGFIRRNTETTRRKDLYVNSIREVERITGMTFFPTLPKEIAESVKSQANLRDWDQELFRQR